MGLSYTLRLYKGPTSAAFRSAMESAATASNAQLIWNRKKDHEICLAHNNDVHILYIPHQDGAGTFFCSALGEYLAQPWMELRIQEGSLWDYSLYDGEVQADTFSTCPQYWQDRDNPDAEFIKQWQGDPKVLARLWNVPLESIEKYLVNWGYGLDPANEMIFRYQLQGKAYPTDRAQYGDYEQYFDFLRTLGGVEPTECHSLHLPPRSE